MLKTVRKLYSILIISGLVLFAACKGPMEKKYNPETFSDDLGNLNKTDRFIVKNVINAYLKNKNADNIAGSETVLIPSLTFKQIRDNYLVFDIVFKRMEKTKLKKQIRAVYENKRESLINAFNKEILKDNLSLKWGKTIITYDPVFKDNNYQRRLILINKLPEIHIINNAIYGVDNKIHQTIYITDIIPSNTSSYGPYGFKKSITEIKKGTPLKIILTNDLSPNLRFRINNITYDETSTSFINKYGSQKIKDETDKRIKSLDKMKQSDFNKIDTLADSLFTPMVWPYDNTYQVSSLENKILENCSPK